MNSEIDLNAGSDRFLPDKKTLVYGDLSAESAPLYVNIDGRLYAKESGRTFTVSMTITIHIIMKNSHSALPVRIEMFLLTLNQWISTFHPVFNVQWERKDFRRILLYSRNRI